jgi:hypothetical protein
MGSRHYRGKSSGGNPAGEDGSKGYTNEREENAGSHIDDTFGVEAPTYSVGRGTSNENHELDDQTDAVFDNDIQAYIDQELKTLHNDIVNEGVPERFQLLLDMLESKKEKGS